MKGIQWYIQSLPTKRNPNPDFKLITFPLQNMILDYTANLTEMVKDEYGFILKAYLKEIPCETNEKIRLFKQGINICGHEISSENFCMDIKVKLRPNIIIIRQQPYDAEDKDLVFNDKVTSDFTIKLYDPKESEGEGDAKEFHVHSTVLTSRSDYFRALFNSKMLESQNRCLKLVDISYFILEKLLLFIYTDHLEKDNEFGDWIDLLYAASRFLIHQLIQFCELSIRKFVDYDNVKKIKEIAYECGAFQLAKFCEMFDERKEVVNEGLKSVGKKPVKFMEKFKRLLTSLVRNMKYKKKLL